MKQVLDRHIPKRLAAAIMIGGLAIGMTAGYLVFGYRSRPESPERYLRWVFPSATPPRVSPPAGAPALTPPPGLPPQ